MSKKKYDGLFSTMDEVHVFLIGLFEGIIKPFTDASVYYLLRSSNEFHYYIAGRATAVIGWLVTGVLLMLAIKAVWF